MTTHEPWGWRIECLINNLPLSDIRFLCFKENNKKLTPVINKSARVWTDTSVYATPLYVISGTRSSNYCYIHRESELRYNVYLDELGEVKHFEPNYDQEVIHHKGGSFVVRANWGDHITIGVDTKKKILMLCSHLTKYIWDETSLDYERDSLYCNVPFTNSMLEENALCYTSGKADGTTMEKYKTLGEDPDAFRIIQAIHKRIVSQGTTGGTHPKQKHPRAKLMKGGNTMYMQDGFSDDFVQFIQETKINPVASQRPNLCEVIVVDDQENKHMMIRYNEDHGDGMDEWVIRSSVFAMDKAMVDAAFAIYQIPVRERTTEQTQIYTEFINTGLVAVGQLVAAY